MVHYSFIITLFVLIVSIILLAKSEFVSGKFWKIVFWIFMAPLCIDVLLIYGDIGYLVYEHTNHEVLLPGTSNLGTMYMRCKMDGYSCCSLRPFFFMNVLYFLVCLGLYFKKKLSV